MISLEGLTQLNLHLMKAHLWIFELGADGRQTGLHVEQGGGIRMEGGEDCSWSKAKLEVLEDQPDKPLLLHWRHLKKHLLQKLFHLFGTLFALAPLHDLVESSVDLKTGQIGAAVSSVLHHRKEHSSKVPSIVRISLWCSKILQKQRIFRVCS